ncbi:hypothetical protein [Cupriavidus oxalaticus]|uniref:hypothetical protein n=1 Tax=Cupriavidus oxalaticus TaxID=96344 RepID=UPI003172EC94
MKKPLWYGRTALLAALLSLTLSACGGGDDSGGATSQTLSATPQASKSAESRPNLHCAP